MEALYLVCGVRRSQLMRVSLGSRNPMKHRHPALSAGLAAFSIGGLVALASCSDLFGPSVRVGTYHLTLVDEQPAPFFLSDDHFSAGNRIVVEQVADSIHIESRFTLVRERSIRTWFYGSDETLDTLTSGWSGTASYDVNGRRMIIVYPVLGGVFPPISPETLRVVDDRTLIGHHIVAGWCTVAQPPECPTVPHLSDFTYERK